MKKSLIMFALLLVMSLYVVSLGADVVVRYVNHPFYPIDNQQNFATIWNALSNLNPANAYNIRIVPTYSNDNPVATQFNYPWSYDIEFNNSLVIEGYLLNGNSAKNYVYLLCKGFFVSSSSNQPYGTLDSTYVVFKNMNFINTGSYSHGIEFGNRNGIVDNCSFSDSNPFGITAQPYFWGIASTSDGLDYQSVNYKLFIKNTTITNACYGVYSALIEHKTSGNRNLARNIYIDNLTANQAWVGMQVGGLDTLLVQNSYFVGNNYDAVGLCYASVNNAQILNTDFFDYDKGIDLYYSGITVANCDFRVKSYGFYYDTTYTTYGDNVVFRGNTIRLINSTVSNPVGFWLKARGSYHNLSFYQNTIVSENSNNSTGISLTNCNLNYYIHANIIWGFNTSIAVSDVTNCIFDYNDWGSNPSDVLPVAITPNPSHNKRLDPKFVSRVDYRSPFSLAPGSPCINSGAPTPPNPHYAVFYDFMWTTIEMGARTYVPQHPKYQGVMEEDNTQAVSVQGVFPNPFNPSTTIRYNTSKAGNVIIDIFNSRGKLVTHLVDEYKTGGDHSVLWNGLDGSGQKATSGLYIYRIKCEDVTVSGKMMLMK